MGLEAIPKRLRESKWFANRWTGKSGLVCRAFVRLACTSCDAISGTFWFAGYCSWRFPVPRSHHRSEAGNSRERSASSCADECPHFTAPGKTIEKGTILIRDGLIVEVGADVKVPAEARVWIWREDNLPGVHRCLQPVGFAGDAQTKPARSDVDQDDPNAKPKEIPRESAQGNALVESRVTPERKAAEYLNVDKKATRRSAILGSPAR